MFVCQAIVELASDKKWRVRLAIIEQIPILGKQLGEKFFDHRVGKLFIEWLNDGFFQIRETTAANLGLLGACVCVCACVRATGTCTQLHCTAAVLRLFRLLLQQHPEASDH